MAETTARGPFARVMDEWSQSLRDLGMDSTGHFTVPLNCQNCGCRLGERNPAEVHAGCYNGLCYRCTSSGPYIEAIAVLDGARRVSWPPHCPSWRRDRETHIAYADCTNCGGWGATGYHSMDHAARYCEPCLDRYSNHPLRVMNDSYRRRLREVGQEVFDRKRCQAAGVPKRCSYKRRTEMLAALPEETTQALRVDIMKRYRGLEARAQARQIRLGVNAWRPPRPGDNLAFGQRSCKVAS
jgi:hypothetical protein